MNIFMKQGNPMQAGCKGTAPVVLLNKTIGSLLSLMASSFDRTPLGSLA
jgi:hypothetical protein